MFTFLRNRIFSFAIYKKIKEIFCIIKEGNVSVKCGGTFVILANIINCQIKITANYKIPKYREYFVCFCHCISRLNILYSNCVCFVLLFINTHLNSNTIYVKNKPITGFNCQNYVTGDFICMFIENNKTIYRSEIAGLT